MKYKHQTHTDILEKSMRRTHRLIEGQTHVSNEISRKGFSYYRGNIIPSQFKPLEFKFNSSDLGLIPINLFGCEGLYAMVDSKTLESYFNILQLTYDRIKFRLYLSSQEIPEVSNENSLRTFLVAGQILNDTPIQDGVNIDVRPIHDNVGTTAPWVALESIAVQALTRQLNEFYRQNAMDQTAMFDLIKIPSNSDLAEIESNEEDQDEDNGVRIHKPISNDHITQFLANTVSMEDAFGLHLAHQDYDYLLIDYPMGNYRFSKNLECGETCVLVQIGRTGIWQSLSHKKYKTLRRISSAKIRYAKTDNERFIDHAVYKEEFVADSIKSIIETSTMLCMDLDYRKQIANLNRSSIRPKDRMRTEENSIIMDYTPANLTKTYEALEISVEQQSSVATALLTQYELGIDERIHTYSLPDRFQIGRGITRFCLLNLIFEIAKLQHSRTKDEWRYPW